MQQAGVIHTVPVMLLLAGAAGPRAACAHCPAATAGFQLSTRVPPPPPHPTPPHPTPHSTNPDNTLEDNAAAATEGWGFFVHTRLAPRGLSATRWPDVRPYLTPLRRFAGNWAHSCRMCLEMEADAVDAGGWAALWGGDGVGGWRPCVRAGRSCLGLSPELKMPCPSAHSASELAPHSHCPHPPTHTHTHTHTPRRLPIHHPRLIACQLAAAQP